MKIRGRLPRSKFWVLLFRFNMLMVVPILVAILVFEVSRFAAIAIFALAIMALVVVSCLLLVRRLNDLNLSGLWLLVIIPVYVAFNITVDNTGGGDLTATAGILTVVYLAIAILIGFKRGSKGPNKYGPDPLMSS